MVPNLEAALTDSQNAAEQLIANATSSDRSWQVPCAPGKWSPSQIVEHVARSYEASVDVAVGRPSAFPSVPRLLHPISRVMLRYMLRRGALPKARTTKAMNPSAVAGTAADGRARLLAAHEQFVAACRQVAANGQRVRTPMFGEVALGDFVRFIALHTRHHNRQIV